MRLWPRSGGTTVPVVRLQGTIGLSSPLRPGLSFAAVAPVLRRAFAGKGPAVAFIVNSPGGAPAQSSLIYGRIRQLAAEKKKHVHVFVEDVAASGGYWLAIAGDDIHADPTSIVGSIGVVSAGFGFPELLQKLGVERRVYTTGENKAILDPFRPEKSEDIAILRTIQSDIQDAFVGVVRERRGAKLADDPDLFTGRVWTGASAVAKGLVDGLGDIHTVLKARYGPRVVLRPIGAARAPFWRRLTTGPALSGEDLIGAVRADRLWDRYGL